METHPPRDISRSQSVQDKVFTSVTIDKAELGVGNVNFFHYFHFRFTYQGIHVHVFELKIITIWLSVVCLISKIKTSFFYLYVLLIGFCLPVTVFQMWGPVKVEFLTFNFCFWYFPWEVSVFWGRKYFFLFVKLMLNINRVKKLKCLQ